jgi:DNA-binding XRE family transcriptional regulator
MSGQIDESSVNVPTSRPAPLPVSTMPELVLVLRRAREERGLSQADVAEALFVAHTSVSHWERGACRPAAGLLICWARVVGMPLWLVPEAVGEVVATCRPAHGGMDASLHADLGSDTHPGGRS